VDCKEIFSEGVDLIRVAECRVKGRAVVTTERDFGFLKMQVIVWSHDRLLIREEDSIPGAEIP
jgi:hypothetical protein